MTQLKKPLSSITEITIKALEEEVFHKVTSITSEEFILSYPRGAYTSSRTIKQNGIFSFTFHLQRLYNSYESIFKSLSSDHKLNIVQLKDLYKQSLSSGTNFYLKKFCFPNNEIKITTLLTHKDQKLIIASHFTSLKSPPSSCKVKLLGRIRHNPTAKDTQWVQERKKFTDLIVPPINEILLYNPETLELYEGMSSNLFVIKKIGSKFILQTAPLNEVLPGTIQKMVIAILKDLGYSISFTYPSIFDLRTGLWEGAFITSTSRLILPIDEIFINDHESTSLPIPSIIYKLQHQLAVQMESETVYV